MTISGNYPTPVMVNGYSCKNCTDVDYAKKHIDPAHPKSGPYNIDAKTDPTRTLSNIISGKPAGSAPTNASLYSAAGQAVSASDPGQQLDTVA